MTQWEPAYEDWKAGMRYKDIAEKHGVTLTAIKTWAKRYFKPEWEKEQAEVATTQPEKLQPEKGLQPPGQRKPGGQPGNKNALGNHGGAPAGNQNDLKHGFYRKALPPEAAAMMDDRGPISEEQRLLNELDLWEYREMSIMQEIQKYKDTPGGLALDSVTKGEKGTSTTAVSSFDYIHKLEHLLSSAQRGYQRCVKDLHEIRKKQKPIFGGDDDPDGSDNTDSGDSDTEDVIFYIPENGRDKRG